MGKMAAVLGRRALKMGHYLAFQANNDAQRERHRGADRASLMSQSAILAPSATRKRRMSSLLGYRLLDGKHFLFPPESSNNSIGV